MHEKFGFDYSAGAGFEVQEIVPGAALAPNSFEHVVDLIEKIGALAGFSPATLCHVDELILERAGHGACPGEGVQLPKLGAAQVVRFISGQRTNKRTFFPVWPQPRIECR